MATMTVYAKQEKWGDRWGPAEQQLGRPLAWRSPMITTQSQLATSVMDYGLHP